MGEPLIEPGIAEVCRLINESGIGETYNSCEGHVYSERQEGIDRGLTYDPIVGFAVADLQRLAALVPALMAVKGPDYYCKIILYDPRMLGARERGTCAEIIMDVDTFKPVYKRGPKAQAARAEALIRAREHLLAVLAKQLRA